jgi:hypothetical protein
MIVVSKIEFQTVLVRNITGVFVHLCVFFYLHNVKSS